SLRRQAVERRSGSSTARRSQSRRGDVASFESQTVRLDTPARQGIALPEPLCQVQFAVERPVRVRVGSSVWCDSNLSRSGADVGHHGLIGRYELLPELARPGRDIQLVNPQREVTALPDEEMPAIRTPLQRDISIAVAFKRSRISRLPEGTQ